MGSHSIKALKRQAANSLRSGDFAAAVSAYCELEASEPTNPLWPRRCADALVHLGDREQVRRALERVAELLIDSGDVIQAIATCKEILEIDPDHVDTLDRLHLLYSEGGGIPPFPVSAVDAAAPTPSTPLEEVLLTEALPGATPAGSDDLGDMGIAEIPLLSEAPSAGMRDPLNEVQPIDEKGPASNLRTTRDELTRTSLFRSLSREDLHRLIKGVRLVQLREGEILFRQGDPADALYVVADGAVIPIAEEETRRKLAVLEAGSFFGEIGLITNQPRNATIQALVNSRLLAIDRGVIWKLIRGNEKALRVILRFLRDRLIDRLVRTHPFFAAFPNQQRREIAGLFRFLEVKNGKTLIEQGSITENLYVLLAGDVQVIQMNADGDKLLATLNPGSIFGEMSLLGNEPAVAAVVASGKCWVLALPKQRFNSLLERTPGIRADIADLAQTRRTENRNLFKTPVADDDIGPLA